MNNDLGTLSFKQDSSGNWGYCIGGADTVNPFKKASDYMKGNATTAQVLSGYTFTNASSVNISGSMTNNGAKTATLNCGGSYTIPEGYHNGSGKITANSAANQSLYTKAQYDSNYTTGYNAGVSAGGVKQVVTIAKKDGSNLTKSSSYTVPGFEVGKVGIVCLKGLPQGMTLNVESGMTKWIENKATFASLQTYIAIGVLTSSSIKITTNNRDDNAHIQVFIGYFK